MNVISSNGKKISFNLVFFVRLFFCYYFDFNGNRFLRYLAKLFCIVCGTILTCFSLYFIYTYYFPYVVPFVLVGFDFCVNIIVSCSTGDSYYFKFFHEIKAIDSVMAADQKICKMTQCFINLILLWIVLIDIVFAGSYCYYSPKCQATLPMILGPTYILMAVDINQVPRLIVLFLILSRMHLLSRKIENYSLSDFVMCDQTKNWSNYLNVYWQLMDCFRLVEPLMKNLLLINLLTTFPKLMAWIYHSVILVDANSADSIEAVIVTCIKNAHVALLTSLPGVLVAMIQARIDSIKLTLATRLYLSKDVKEIDDIQKFLKLIELRPFELRILRVIPVDMNLPVGLLSLCATYLIVLAQFHE